MASTAPSPPLHPPSPRLGRTLRRSVRYFEDQIAGVMGETVQSPPSPGLHPTSPQLLLTRESRSGSGSPMPLSPSPLPMPASAPLSGSHTAACNSPACERFALAGKPKRSTEPLLLSCAAKEQQQHHSSSSLSSLPAFAPTLEEVLETPTLWAAFNRFLAGQNASESLLFLRDVARCDPKQTRDIYERYLRTGAPFEVNVSADARRRIAERFDADAAATEPAPSAAVFAPAQVEVLQMLRAGLFAEWLRTEEWRC